MQERIAEIDELIEACSDSLGSMIRLTAALKKLRNSGASRPTLILLTSTIEEGLKRLEDGFNVLDPIEAKDSGDHG